MTTACWAAFRWLPKIPLEEIFYTKSRMNGDYRFELPNEYGYRNDIVVSAGVGSLFPVVTKDAQFGGNFQSGNWIFH